VLRWNADTHMHRVRLQVPFYDQAALLHRQLVQYLPKVLVDRPKYRFFRLFAINTTGYLQSHRMV